MNIKNLILETVGYQSFDSLNGFTISFTLAVFLTILQAWGLWKQNTKIKKNESGESLSLIFFSAQFLYFFGYVIYGLYIHDLVIILNNFLFLFFIPIIANLIRYKYRKLKKNLKPENKTLLLRKLIFEITLSALLFLIFLPIIFWINNKDLMIAILLVVVIISTIPQAYDILIKKNTKNIELKFIIAFMLSSFLWLSYGIIGIISGSSIGWGFITSCSLTLLISTLLLIVCKIFNKKSSIE